MTSVAQAARVPSWLPEDFRFSVSSNEAAMVTRKVKYFVDDGKLNYKVLDEDVHYKTGSMKYRPNNW